AEELKFDVRVLAEALDESGNLAVCRMEVEPWLVRIDAFGMQTARLDIRQHTSVYRQVMEELFSVMGRSANPAALSEEEFEKLVLETLENPPSLPVWRISPSSAETLALFSVIRRV